MTLALLHVRLEARCGEKIAASGSVRAAVLPDIGGVGPTAVPLSLLFREVLAADARRRPASAAELGARLRRLRRELAR